MRRLLALDYGLVHTGIALATSNLAEPLRTVPTQSLNQILPKLIKQHHITHLIIGISENRMAHKTRQFAASLKKIINTPIIFQDETLSSQLARQKLTHASKQKKTGPDHHFAAALILQDYLDQHPLS